MQRPLILTVIPPYQRIDLVCALVHVDSQDLTFDIFDQRMGAFVQKVDSLIRRADIMRSLRRLHVSVSGLNFWAADFQDHARDFVERATPIWSNVDTLLRHIKGLESLSLGEFLVRNDLLASIIGLPRLHTLELEGCNLQLEQDTPLPSSTSILNLIVREAITSTRQTAYHVLFPSMPNLRYLLHSGAVEDSQIASATTNSHLKVFRTIEQLQFCRPDYEELDTIVEWMREGVRITGNHLRITHFRMMSPHHRMEEADVRAFLRILRGAPLRCLSLEGLSYARPDLFDEIAGACPGLEELTLAYSHNNDIIASSTAWPCLAQAYAPHFARFAKLKHFSWNFAIPDVMYSPAIMLAFEDGFDVHGELPFEFPEDTRSMFGLFAAYAQSLETLEFWKPILLDRRADGTVREASESDDTDDDGPHTRAGFILRPPPKGSWPTILPQKKS